MKLNLSYSELILRAINALKCADGSMRDPNHAGLCLAAARTWTTRAEYSLETDLELSEEDFSKADQIMFERRKAIESV